MGHQSRQCMHSPAAGAGQANNVQYTQRGREVGLLITTDFLLKIHLAVFLPAFNLSGVNPPTG